MMARRIFRVDKNSSLVTRASFLAVLLPLFIVILCFGSWHSSPIVFQFYCKHLLDIKIAECEILSL